jgi:Flp pilus assembly protein TadD
MVDKGWGAVEKGDLSGGAAAFQKALGLKPGDAAASFGLGYVLLKQGNAAAAAPHLCRASQSGGSDAREASGLLAANDLTCP